MTCEPLPERSVEDSKAQRRRREALAHAARLAERRPREQDDNED